MSSKIAYCLEERREIRSRESGGMADTQDLGSCLALMLMFAANCYGPTIVFSANDLRKNQESPLFLMRPHYSPLIRTFPGEKVGRF
jgi:hypothetical protein